MTLVECVLFILVAILFARAMRPIQRRLEKWLLKSFRSKNGSQATVINITDYTKETIPKDKNK